MGSQQFCLKWNNHQTNMLVVFEQLLSSEALVDVTLACEGLSLKAHKMVLSACSPFFQSLFLENPCKHPIVILKDMKYTDLKAIVDFMYRGEVNVSQDQLSALLKTAETLKVKGLAEVTGEQRQGSSGVVQQEIVPHCSNNQATTSGPQQQPRVESPLLNRRKRGRVRRRSRSDSNCSDAEDQVPSKIKEPDSPEIVEEISRDTSESSEIRQKLAASNQTQVPISHPAALPISSRKSISTIPSVQDSHVTVEEPPSGDETEFEVEPSKLMEQSMADTVPVYTDDPSQGATLPPVSNQLSVSTVGLVDTQSHHTASGPCGDSQALVPCSMPSEPSTSSHITQDTTEDIKPLVSFEEDPPVSPVAGPSHQDSNSMMMYMDTSVSSMPGPSNYQVDKPPQSQQSQPQVAEDLMKHLKIEEKVYKCLLCPHIVHTPWELREHHLGMHAGSGPYKCTSCSEMFPTLNHLKYHILIHEKCPFQCSCCGKLFELKGDLQAHAYLHTTENLSYQCSSCEKSFTNKTLLQRHTLTHTGERPHKCSYCGKLFSQKGNLRYHILLHTGNRPHQCSYCGRSFTQKIHLQRHILIHTGERPYQCTVCGRAFRHKNSLQIHIPLHTGEKPHQCSYCQKSFSSRTILLRHIRKHTINDC